MSDQYQPVSETADQGRMAVNRKLERVRREHSRLMGRKIAFIGLIVVIIILAVGFIITLGPLGMTIP